jgi:hypothetical protein
LLSGVSVFRGADRCFDPNLIAPRTRDRYLLEETGEGLTEADQSLQVGIAEAIPGSGYGFLPDRGPLGSNALVSNAGKSEGWR